MERHAVHTLGDFSLIQWSRIANSIRRNCQHTTGQDCQVAIGIKETGGQLQPGFPVARIYLPKKRGRVSQNRRLADEIEVRLKTKPGSYQRICLGIDVDCLASFEANAKRRHSSQSNSVGNNGLGDANLTVRTDSPVRADGIVQWLDDAGQRHWGIITVAHLFDQIRQRTLSIRLAPRLRVRCQRLIKGSKRSGYDVAILWIRQPSAMILDRLEQWTCQANDNRAGLEFSQCDLLAPPLSTAALIQAIDERISGKTFGTSPAAPFTPTEFFPNGVVVSGRKLAHCVKVHGQRRNVFPPGTSGALWTLGDHWACMQAASKQPDSQIGLGQPLDQLLSWLRNRGTDARGHRWSTLQLVAVRTLE